MTSHGTASPAYGAAEAGAAWGLTKLPRPHGRDPSWPRSYRNIFYTFSPVDPPNVPHDENPTGCYRTTFTLPTSWGTRPVLIEVGQSVWSLCLPGASV